MIGNGCFLCRIDYREIHKSESINTLFHFQLYLEKENRLSICSETASFRVYYSIFKAYLYSAQLLIAISLTSSVQKA